MTNGPFFERVLDRLMRRGLVHTEAAKRMGSMCVHGVHVEQVAVGGGFVSPEAYGDVLADVSGLPFLRPQEAVVNSRYAWPTELSQEGSWPLLVDGSTWTVGFVEPRPSLLGRVKDFLQKQRRKLQPAMMLRADWRRAALQPSSTPTVAAMAGQVFGFADRVGASSVRLLGLGGETVVLPDIPQTEPLLRLPSDILSALRLRLLRQAKTRGWVAKAKRVPGGWWIHLVRERSNIHPAEWSTGLQQFLSRPKGLFVVVGPDEYLEHHFLHAQAAPKAWREADGMQAMRAYTSEEQEVALHTALYGHPVLALTDGRDAWWEEAGVSGVPLTILRGHDTRHGKAWSSYRYA